MAKWVMETQEFDFTIQHVPGRKHHGPDLLSREGCLDAAVDATVEDIASRRYLYMRPKKKVIPYTNLKDIDWTLRSINHSDFKRAQEADSALQAKAARHPDHYSKTDGIWRHRMVAHGTAMRVVMPNDLDLKIDMLVVAHSLTGHRGVKPIVKMLARIFFWPKLREFAQRFIRACSDCTRRKARRNAKVGISPTILVQEPMRKLMIDFILQSLPESDGYIYALLIIDCFTRYCWAIPLKTKDSEEIARALFDNVFSQFGFPMYVHSDNETSLIEMSLLRCFLMFNVRRTFILTGHPTGNSQVERLQAYIQATLTIILPR